MVEFINYLAEIGGQFGEFIKYLEDIDDILVKFIKYLTEIYGSADLVGGKAPGNHLQDHGRVPSQA